MSVTSHLKDLLTKMGGTPKNGDSTSVLIDKIEDVYNGSGSGGGGSSGGVSSYNDLTDRPFDVTKDYITLFEETVTAEERSGVYGAQLAYTGTLDEDIIKVTFDGTEYICEKYIPDLGNLGPHGSFYGGIYSESGPDFSEYPFIIGPNNIIMTEMPGTHTIKVETGSENITTTEDFEKAVNSVQNNSSGSSSGNTFVVTIYADTAEDIAGSVEGVEVHFKMDKTLRQIMGAYDNGVIVTLMLDGMKRFDPAVFNDEKYDTNHPYTWFCPRANNSEHLNSLGYMNNGGISVVSSEFVNQYGGTNDEFGYYTVQFAYARFFCEKEPNIPYHCGFEVSDESLPLDFLDAFDCDNLDDYPISIKYSNMGES